MLIHFVFYTKTNSILKKIVRETSAFKINDCHLIKKKAVNAFSKYFSKWAISLLYRVFYNCWNKAIGHKSNILNDTTMMITFIERWKDNIL